MNFFLLIIFLITITHGHDDSAVTNCGQCNNLFIALYKLDDHLAMGYIYIYIYNMYNRYTKLQHQSF